MEKAKKSTKSTSVAKKSAAKTTKKIPAKKTAAKKPEKVLKKTAVKEKISKPSKSAAIKPAAKKIVAKKSAAKKAPAKKRAPKDESLALLAKCFKAMDDKKAMDLRALDMRGASSITNYVLLATATSEPHMRALANELEKTLKDLGIAARREFGAGSGWFVVDAFDFMAHIFLAEQRDNYRMEALWKDAEEIPESLLFDGE